MLSINVSELIWTIVNFFLLYFLLKRFQALNRETEARAAAEENEKEIEAQKALRREEAAAILSEAQRADAERSREAFAEAKEKAARSLADANAALCSEGERQRASLEAETGELAAMLAEKLLDGGK